jgi:aminoglycoside 3-N-acetyltransferase I
MTLSGHAISSPWYATIMSTPHFRRLGQSDTELAFAMFSAMACAFGEPFRSPSPDYVARLLSRNDFWAVAALVDGRPIGGLTAFSLPLTCTESMELFIYDIAVQPEHQRRGIGRQLVQQVRELAAENNIMTTWVPAENEDGHALEFYRSIGGVPNPVTVLRLKCKGKLFHPGLPEMAHRVISRHCTNSVAFGFKLASVKSASDLGFVSPRPRRVPRDSP